MAGKAEIDHVREATDLIALVGEQVPLRPRGREHIGLCPFHDDHTPSLAVVTHKGNAFYKCHACGAAGDAFNFVMDYHKMSFAEALRYLADRAGIKLTPQAKRTGAGPGPTRSELLGANAVAASLFRDTLAHAAPGAAARAVIDQRRISEETADAFMLGAAPAEWESLERFAAGRSVSVETLTAAGLLKPRPSGQGYYDTFRNRLMFPICDELGRPVAFGGRQLEPDDAPKYLNSPESPVFHKSRTLYGLHLAKRAIIEARQIIVTEGYTDVLACHQAGLRHVVATLGTALTREHAQVLKRLCEVVLLVFDGDEAGQRAAGRAVELFFAEPVDVRICILPEGQDPADLLQGPDGLERFETALAGSHDALEFKVMRFRDELRGAVGLGARHRCLERVMEDLAGLGFHTMPGIRKGPVLGRLAELLRVPIEEIERALPRGRRPASTAARSGAPEPPAAAQIWELSEETSAARRRAERELLSVLIYQPSLRTQPVAVRDEPALPVTRLFEPRQFCDPAARRLAEAVWNRLSADEDFTVQQLMGGLDDPRLRSLAGGLYLEGERVCGPEEPSTVDRFRGLCATFDTFLRRERYQRSLEAYRQAKPDASRGDDALLGVLEQRRQQGYIPEVIPARLRS
ncbi:MAG: DNA primase [Planctomycetota bacterium]